MKKDEDVNKDLDVSHGNTFFMYSQEDPACGYFEHVPIVSSSFNNGYISDQMDYFPHPLPQHNVDHNIPHCLNWEYGLTCLCIICSSTFNNMNNNFPYALTSQVSEVKTYPSYAYPYYLPLDFHFDADFASYPLQPDNTLLDFLQCTSQNELMMPQQTYYSVDQYCTMFQEEYPILTKQSPSASSMESTTNGANTSVFTTPDERDNHSTPGNIPEIFPCTFQGCEKTFSKSHLLKSHQTCHWSERPFACPYAPCSSKFARTHDLKRHEKTHTGSKPYICRSCQYKFARSDTLRRHVKTKKKCLKKYREDSSRLNVHTTGQQ